MKSLLKTIALIVTILTDQTYCVKLDHKVEVDHDHNDFLQNIVDGVHSMNKRGIVTDPLANSLALSQTEK